MENTNENGRALDDAELEGVTGGTDVKDPTGKGDRMVRVKCDNPYCGKGKSMLLSALSSPIKSKCECGGRFNVVK